MQPLWNPAENFLQGLTVAQRIKDTLARRQMEERQLKMAEEEQARSREVRNIQLLGEIVRNARPVSEAGTVTENTNMSTRLQGLPSAMQQDAVNVQNVRPARPDAFTFNGQRFEFLNQNDIDARDLEKARLVGGQQNSQFLERSRGQEDIAEVSRNKDRELRRELTETGLDARQKILEAQMKAKEEADARERTFRARANYEKALAQSDEKALDRDNRLQAAQIAANRPRGSGGAAASDSMVQAVMANPQLFQQLTPTQRTALIPQLQAAGFQGFGKDAAAMDIRKVGEIQSAIDEVADLRKAMKDGGEYVGPIAGWNTVNPWSGARALQAKVDAVRQRVGKALEGGVLRKEDEEKYKRILPTMFDTPATVEYKINELEKSLKNDMGNIQKAQQGVGRRAPQMGGAAPAGGGIDLSQFER